jgi:hypothetical protein
VDKRTLLEWAAELPSLRAAPGRAAETAHDLRQPANGARAS